MSRIYHFLNVKYLYSLGIDNGLAYIKSQTLSHMSTIFSQILLILIKKVKFVNVC